MIALVEKLNKDLERAKIEENYFSFDKSRQVKIKCPVCYKSNLAEACNRCGDIVYQRVVNCDECGWIYSFDAPDNWEAILKDNLHYLGYCVKEGNLDAEDALGIIKEKNWKSIDRMRDQV